ncbi:MAG: hypothetical protein ACI4NG_03195 [Candidatus Gallimonas sp.]
MSNNEKKTGRVAERDKNASGIPETSKLRPAQSNFVGLRRTDFTDAPSVQESGAFGTSKKPPNGGANFFVLQRLCAIFNSFLLRPFRTAARSGKAKSRRTAALAF